MLKGLQRRYTLEQIEAQDESLIVPRLNYNALNTLRNPLYKKYSAQIENESKAQGDRFLEHRQTLQTINNIANHNGVNAAELHIIMENLMERFQKDDDMSAPPQPPMPRDDDMEDVGGPSEQPTERSTRYPNETQRLDEWNRDHNLPPPGALAATAPNNEMYRINLELHAHNQQLRQEAETRAKQDAARRQITTPHREELRSIVQNVHQHIQQPVLVAPSPAQDNSQIIGALENIASLNHNLGKVLEEGNLNTRLLAEMAHHSMQAQRGERGDAPSEAPVAVTPQRPPRSRSPPKGAESKRVTKKDAPMPAATPVALPTPSTAPTPIQPQPLPLPMPQPLPSEEDPERAPARSRSKTPVPKLAPQSVAVKPTSVSTKGEEMRQIIAILDGSGGASGSSGSSGDALLRPENPPIVEEKPKAAHPKKAKVIKQLKASDRQTEKQATNDDIRKGVTEFFSKQKPTKARATSVQPKPTRAPSLPTPSFDDIAAQLDEESFLDNPVDRKRDTRRREVASSSSAAARPRSAATPAAAPAVVRSRSMSATAVAPRVLKTQRADSAGTRRVRLETLGR
jgi:hypothetical protein